VKARKTHIVVGPLVVVVVTPVAGVVAVVPVETTLLEELVRQLESAVQINEDKLEILMTSETHWKSRL
jgi:hypothetical protein